MRSFGVTFVLSLVAIPQVAAFVPRVSKNKTSKVFQSASTNQDFVVNPAERDSTYKGNIAQYLLDLHKAKATFDFCGGMMFQLDLTDALQEHLRNVASSGSNDNSKQPVLNEASKMRMHQLDGYQQSSFADNAQYFYGREIRNVPHAKGGMGMVLQLSLAPSPSADDDSTRIDPQGWSVPEMTTYDGWGSDRGRVWRKGSDYEQEGFDGFREKYGSTAYGLNHRFYLHKDFEGRMWLSAEDGCEGTPAASPVKRNPLESLMKQFL